MNFNLMVANLVNFWLCLVVGVLSSANVYKSIDIRNVLLFSYFTSKNESLHLAFSRNGLNFTALNGNKPVLEGIAPFKGIRDPFINRSPDGNFFHIVATAGTPHSIHYWNLSLTSGKPTFSKDTILPLMADIPGTKECWAPEWVWDPFHKDGQYLITYASQTPASPDGKRIWAIYSPDFSVTTLGKPFTLLQPNFTVIDADPIRLSNGTTLLYFKDERGTNTPPQPYKAVRQAVSSSPSGPFSPESISDILSPHMTEGPELVEFPNPTGDPYILYYDCFQTPYFGVSTSKDLIHFKEVAGSSCANPGSSIVFPDGARHGSFVAITEKELSILLKSYPSN